MCVGGSARYVDVFASVVARFHADENPFRSYSFMSLLESSSVNVLS